MKNSELMCAFPLLIDQRYFSASALSSAASESAESRPYFSIAAASDTKQVRDGQSRVLCSCLDEANSVS